MKKSRISNKSRTDWNRLDALKESDIDLSDAPEITPEMFARAVVRRGLKAVPNKAQVTLRLDRDVLTWFKKQGRGYQTRINSLLRAYMEVNRADQRNTRSTVRVSGVQRADSRSGTGRVRHV